MAEILHNATQKALLEAGKREFLEFGYEKASLRVIAKRAGVTTGAIYGYFPDKSSLFDALVAEPADDLYQGYVRIVNEFESLSPEDQFEKANTMPGKELDAWIDLIYGNLDAFKLVFSCSSGTRWEEYLDSLIKVEEDSSLLFISRLREQGMSVPQISRHMVHLLASAFFQAIAEVVIHGMTREEAREYIALLTEFFTAGWNKLLDLRE